MDLQLLLESTTNNFNPPPPYYIADLLCEIGYLVIIKPQATSYNLSIPNHSAGSSLYMCQALFSGFECKTLVS